jgi:short-subunit dehydrogenase
MNSQAAKAVRKQLRNVVQELLPALLQTEVFATLRGDVEKSLRETFGARLEAINDSIMAQLKTMDDRSQQVQQFIMNQIQAELARTAPQAVVDQSAPESAQLQPAESEQREENQQVEASESQS